MTIDRRNFSRKPAIHQKRQNPRESAQGVLGVEIMKVPRACWGFTLVEIMIVVAIIGLLAAIAIPTYIRARTATQKNACINNLRHIEDAIQEWAMETRKPQSADVTFSDISPYLRGAVVCPAGGISFVDSYTISTVAESPACQLAPLSHIWMGSDAELASGGSTGTGGKPGPGNNGNGHGNGNSNGNGHGNGNSNGNGNGNGNGN